MADFIQSEIRLIHVVGKEAPTKNKQETKAGRVETKTIEEESPAPNGKETGDEIMKRGRRAVGKFAIARRSVRVFESLVNMEVGLRQTRAYNRAMLSGDSRKAVEAQNQMTMTNAIIGEFKAMTMSAVTSVATGNPYIMLMYLTQTLTDRFSGLVMFQEQMRVYEEQKRREIEYSKYRQERLLFNTFRR